MHLLVAFNPKCSGRYICNEGVLYMTLVADVLLQHVPELAGLIHPPTKTIPDFLALAVSLFDPDVSFKNAWDIIGEEPPRFDNSRGGNSFLFVFIAFSIVLKQ
jgi:hypothetical protein